jgi:hypothetical protein
MKLLQRQGVMNEDVQLSSWDFTNPLALKIFTFCFFI